MVRFAFVTEAVHSPETGRVLLPRNRYTDVNMASSPAASWRDAGETPPLRPPGGEQRQDDEEDDAEPAARVITPSSAVGPRRQGANESQHQDDDQDCRQHCVFPLSIR